MKNGGRERNEAFYHVDCEKETEDRSPKFYEPMAM